MNQVEFSNLRSLTELVIKYEKSYRNGFPLITDYDYDILILIGTFKHFVFMDPFFHLDLFLFHNYHQLKQQMEKLQVTIKTSIFSICSSNSNDWSEASPAKTNVLDNFSANCSARCGLRSISLTRQRSSKYLANPAPILPPPIIMIRR